MLTRKKISADFCVVGGGMSGICAAVAAAREGCSVVLMHERPVLGGNASSEIRMWVLGAKGENNRETGIIEEILLENYYMNPTKNFYIWDMVLYDFIRREKNITLLLNCTCIDADTEHGSFAYGRTERIRSVTGYQMTTQTFFEVEADNFADCSGDSILAPLTGAEFMLGREGASEFCELSPVKEHDGKVMGMSCLIQGRETDENVKFRAPEWSRKLSDEDFKYHRPDLRSPYENFWYLELGGDRDTIGEAEDISRELVSLAAGTWDHIKNSGQYDADKWDLDFFGFLPGKRESRRMKGEYIITQRDISESKLFEDTAAFGGWPLDVHFPEGFKREGEVNSATETPSPYCVPYRAMYSKNVLNLFFAGRNISVTHMALSSTRVMATCAVIGQAVGTAAAVAAKHGCAPHGVYESYLDELQSRLAENDCLIPNRAREVGAVCKNTPVINGDDTLKDGLDRPNKKLYGDIKCGVSVKNGTALEYSFDKPELVRSVHITFDSDLDRNSLPGDYPDRVHPMRANLRKDSPQTCMPKTLCRCFVLSAVTESGEREIINCAENIKRAFSVDINEYVRGLKLAVLSNWGGTEETNVFSFDFR